MLQNSQTVSTNPDIKQLMFPVGYLRKGIHQIVLSICQISCTRCGQRNNNLNRANAHVCGCGYIGGLFYTGKAVGFKTDSIKLEDDCVDLVIQNRNTPFLPICGILYAV